MSKPRVAGMREPTEEEKALDRWFAEQALASPDNLEAAARTVVARRSPTAWRCARPPGFAAARSPGSGEAR